MKVVVDTSAWSLAFRRSRTSTSPLVTFLADVIRDGRAILLGIVRQELLSGIRQEDQYSRLRDRLRAFPDPLLSVYDYERAAEFNNTCRNHGIQGSTIDFLICAYAFNHECAILTMDGDFQHFAPYIQINLLQAP